MVPAFNSLAGGEDKLFAKLKVDKSSGGCRSGIQCVHRLNADLGEFCARMGLDWKGSQEEKYKANQDFFHDILQSIVSIS